MWSVAQVLSKNYTKHELHKAWTTQNMNYTKHDLTTQSMNYTKHELHKTWSIQNMTWLYKAWTIQSMNYTKHELYKTWTIQNMNYTKHELYKATLNVELPIAVINLGWVPLGYGPQKDSAICGFMTRPAVTSGATTTCRSVVSIRNQRSPLWKAIVLDNGKWWNILKYWILPKLTWLVVVYPPLWKILEFVN